MADSFEKKEREKKRDKKRKDKAARKEQQKLSGEKTAEFMYMGADGQLTTEKPESLIREEVSLDEIQISTPKKEDLEQEDPVKIGIVNNFNKDKGYGFIDQKETGESFFVHINNVEGTIKEGNKVSFETEKGPKGLVAVKVKLFVA
ncbi:cold-shock protein [Wenyingzhuangia sp. 2_MG-2023]|uniref:cold-shock protein n=1 Tax=Wenyingzhuangia sp. 2_MG-2023 TaxID=3062639 RepID=UPI0026E27EDD|nr:cold shock domain-containing protein [Wenyingzhuangia sp. 2_MG-2023]MDO6736508.1 cold shock domain-containing protein [Wenyingzhuangia sp. 2_MG-2023]MDO6801191.1 cold shock domain-containing protein [Wenyingzhuangia sp. 1_MG-2023]